MLNNEQEEKLVQILIDRINALNEDILTIIGNRIKQIGELTPTQVHQIKQMLMYDTDIDTIIKKLAEVTNMNVNDIYNMFEYSAKTNQDFARQFYKARGISYIPYTENKALKGQIRAIEKITAKEYANISRTSAIGYTVKDLKGNLVFKDISSAYKDIIDKAILNVGQGKTTYQQEMRKAIKQIGQSGLKTIDYESGRSMRLDSAIRQNVLDGLRNLNNQLQEQFGEEFDYNMIQISHHTAPAVDHSTNNIAKGQYDIDGHQFAKIDILKQQILDGTEKTIKLEDIQGNRVKVNGKWYYDYDYINNLLNRQISTLNCRHYIFPGILGISKPLYSEEQLKKDKEDNIKGFELDGRHYTKYEASQLLRKIERTIRKDKDIQILAKASGDKDLTLQMQTNITQLTIKYRQICKISGLPNQLKTRGSVSGYRRINIEKM